MSKILRVAAVMAGALALVMAVGFSPTAETQGTEAPTGLSGTNGFLAEFCANQRALTDSPNSPEIPDDECNAEAAEEEFLGPEDATVGLGPIFNAAGCGTCHQFPVIGQHSQILERRAGRFDGTTFFDHPGGSLIQHSTLPTHIQFQERVLPGNNVFARRNTIDLFGAGFVEAIANSTLTNNVNAQPAAQRGILPSVPVLERPGANRLGRFGHKGQQASLLSFSADAYVNEMGITSPLQPDENTSNGTPVQEDVEDPDLPGTGIDDAGVDVELFALFMRDLKAPPRGPITAAVNAGQASFNSAGCAVCHTPSFTTAAPGTFINGGALRVTNTLGNKIIRPFSDFALHDIGTGDGIVQNGGQATRNRIRTTNLWGLRARAEFLHDNRCQDLNCAIQAHGNQAAAARNAFNALSSTSRNNVIAFLNSL